MFDRISTFDAIDALDRSFGASARSDDADVAFVDHGAQRRAQRAQRIAQRRQHSARRSAQRDS